MCNRPQTGLCRGCPHATSRRGFLKRIGTAAAAGALGPGARASEAEAPAAKVRVGLVFFANSAEHEIWPYPGFDCDARHARLRRTLQEGCPGIEFVPVTVAVPEDLPKALSLKDSTDGLLLYATTLNWGLTGPLVQLAGLGKPTVVADEFLGGCGMFLVGYSQLRRHGAWVSGVSSTRDEDLVAVARQFADLKRPGMTPERFTRQCEEAYRRTFATPDASVCSEDDVPLVGIGDCVRRLNDSRFLIVGVGTPGEERNFLGAKGIYAGFDELRALVDEVDRDAAAEWACRWADRAESIVEPTVEWIHKAAAVYLAMRAMMEKHGTDSITVNCLGGFGTGQLPAYPCLGFMQMLNDGGQGVCEAMPDDSVSTLMGRILTGRPGYVSDPALDTSKNRVVYSHCMAHTKAFGPGGPENKFRIRTLHNRDPRGVCAQSFLPEGYMTTSFRTNVERRELVLHQAKAVGNLDADRGCRTQLVGEVRGDIEKLFREWDRFGWHRVTFYGDIREPLIEFGKALGLTVIEET